MKPTFIALLALCLCLSLAVGCWQRSPGPIPASPHAAKEDSKPWNISGLYTAEFSAKELKVEELNELGGGVNGNKISIELHLDKTGVVELKFFDTNASATNPNSFKGNWAWDVMKNNVQIRAGPLRTMKLKMEHIANGSWTLEGLGSDPEIIELLKTGE